MSKEHEVLSIKLYGNDLEQVTEFTYLGSCMAENTSSNANVCARITRALSSFGRLQSIWKDKVVPLTTKVKLLQTLVFIICYACETWTLKADVAKTGSFWDAVLSPSTEYQVARSHYKCRSSNSTGFLHQNAMAAHDQEVPGRVARACGTYASRSAAKHCPAWLCTRKASSWSSS